MSEPTTYFSLNAIKEVIAAVRAVERRPALIGIDGQSGAGKSTIARELCGQLPEPAVVVEGDDFYRPMPETERLALTPEEGYRRYFDWERLRDQVLLPVREGRARLRYQRYDWDTEQMDGWVDEAMPAIVVVEGVYTLRPPLRGLLDVAVAVEASEATRMDRQLDRRENTLEWISRWAAAERHYVTHHPLAERADLVIRGE